MSSGSPVVMKTKRLNQVTLEMYSLMRQARKIFSRAYEEITMYILYDEKERFILLLANKDQSVLFECEVSRAEAFRIINTRP